MKTSRGIRNRNPGNIRRSLTTYKGEVVPSTDREFKQFESMAYGYRAMFVLLHFYSRICYVTLRQMLARYAPPKENRTDRYLAFVVEQSKIGPDTRLDTRNRQVMIPIVAAMSQMENGVAPNLEDIDEGWQLFVRDK